MHPDFQRLMQDATRLTSSGDLRAATAAIQAALNGTAHEASHDASPATDYPPLPGSIVIDVEAREVPQAEAAGHEPRAGEFIAGRWGSGNMAREYKLYIPPNAGERPLPRLLRALSGAVAPGQSARLLELVQAQPSNARSR
jgi:hypothetical protein